MRQHVLHRTVVDQRAAGQIEPSGAETLEVALGVTHEEHAPPLGEQLLHPRVALLSEGSVTDGEHLVIEHCGEIVVDASAHTMAEEGPVYERLYERPAEQDELNEILDRLVEEYK